MILYYNQIVEADHRAAEMGEGEDGGALTIRTSVICRSLTTIPGVARGPKDDGPIQMSRRS